MNTVAVTGASGFIGRNLVQRLEESGFAVASVGHDLSGDVLAAAVAPAKVVFHLAGVNRPKNESEFRTGNEGPAVALANTLLRIGKRIPVVFASSIQAANDNPYGRSKRAAEDRLRDYAAKSGAPVLIFRLPNVFGKWCRPNYNSVVATFCHNIARGLPIEIHDPDARLTLVYIDDVVDAFLAIARDPSPGAFNTVEPVYETTVGALARRIEAFRDSRTTLAPGHVGIGFERALYSTYVSYLPAEGFDYPLKANSDQRGSFVEVMRTPDCGQFSYFTAHPGVTRGGHYHHTKTEKFLVVQGRARFDFRNLLTDERMELVTTGDEPRIVETVPGWVHAITNVGDDTLLVMLWANEVFDKDRPDTIMGKV